MTEPTAAWPTPTPPGLPKPPKRGLGGVKLAGALALTLLVGVGIGSSSSDTEQTVAVADEGDSLSAEDAARLQDNLEKATTRADELESEVSELRVSLAEARSVQQSPPAAAPSAAAPAPAPAKASGSLSDGDWTSEEPKLEKDFAGSFGGKVRVTNVSSGELTAVFTYTLFKGGELVGTLQGSSNEVGAGETATVQLVSEDDFVAGVDRIEFQVDASF